MSLRYLSPAAFLLGLLIIASACKSKKTNESDQDRLARKDSIDAAINSEFTEADFDDDTRFRIMFYNLENLFDTIDTPGKIDAEYLPDAEKKWGTTRYYDKLTKLAKVISGVGGAQPVDLIGICEVESEIALRDLIDDTPLRKYDYGIVHEESPDVRGIDNALLFRKDAFAVLDYKYYRVRMQDTSYKTREILYVTGIARGTDTLHLIVNHFPSRRGGQQASEPRRIQVATYVRGIVDSIYKTTPQPNIIITGDFNDEPHNKSIKQTIGAKLNPDSLTPTDLYNLMAPLQRAGKGTYSYRQNWNMLDQFIVSAPLMTTDNDRTQVAQGRAYIFSPDWVMYTNKRTGTKSPNRSFGGPNYYGGYSDHLAIYLDLIIR